MQPHHIHDCDACKFLGAIPGERGPVDLYVCGENADLVTYVARNSSNGPDYSSETIFNNGKNVARFTYPSIAQAIHRAADGAR